MGQNFQKHFYTLIEVTFCVIKVFNSPQREKKWIIWNHTLSDKSLTLDLEEQSKPFLQEA